MVLKPSFYRHGLIWMFAAALACGMAACKKSKPESAEAAPEARLQSDTNDSAVPMVPGGISLADAAPHTGIAARLPADTEAFFTTINLPKHLEALKASNWAKDVDAFLNDKTPAPSAAKSESGLPDASAAARQLWGRDFFLALGKGGARAVASWQQFLTIQAELQYFTMMQGSLGGGDVKKTKLEQALALALEDADLLKRAAEVVSKLELPPLLLGIQTDKPEEVLKELVPAELVTTLKGKAKLSEVTISKSDHYQIVEGTFSAFLTDEMKKALIASLPADKTEAIAIISKTLDEVQKKPFALAYGTLAGHVVVAIGSSRPTQLQLVDDPAKSLLSRPEMSFVLDYVTKDLTSIFFSQADTLQAMQNPEPMQPIVRGVLAGLRKSPVFAKVAESLAPRAAELSGLERELQDRKFAPATGVAWWDKGLHLELKGGQSPEGLESTRPLRFASLIDDPSVVLGVAYHGDTAMTGKLRALIEAWAVTLYETSGELVKTGLGGPNGPEIQKWADKEIIPLLVNFYTGSKNLFQKGVGNEHAWIIDLGGQVPPLPIFPQKKDKEQAPKMLRIASIDDVSSRTVIADSWTAMQDSLNKLAASFPMLAGQKLPAPEASNKPAGLTTYAYNLMPGVEDLTPCASVNNQMLIIGTSTSQHGDLATRMLHAKPATTPQVARWRLSFPAVREAVKTFSTSSAAPSTADQMKSTIKWLAPLGEANGQMWIQAGNVHHSITIEVKDVLHYD